MDKRLCESLKLLQHFADAKRDIQANTSLSQVEKMKRVKKIRIDDTSVDDLALDFTLPGYNKIELKVCLLLSLSNNRPAEKTLM